MAEGSKFDRLFQNATPPAAAEPTTAEPEQRPAPAADAEKPSAAPAATTLRTTSGQAQRSCVETVFRIA